MEFITLHSFIFLIFVAFIAGLIDSIAGGGGLISLPALLISGIPPHLALGSGKLMSTSGTAFSLLVFAKGKSVNWKIIRQGIIFSIIGSCLGTQLALATSSELLEKIILIILPTIAIILFLPKKNKPTASDTSQKVELLPVAIVCSTVGAYDGFLGAGTGTILLLAIHLFLRMDLIVASGTAKAFNLASNVGGFAVFLLNGSILYTIAIPMAATNILGNIIGSKIALNVGQKVVKKFLAISFALLAITLLNRYFSFF